MKVFIFLALLVSVSAFAGILPTSRGGTGANITPSANAVVTSTSSGFALSTHITLGAGTSVVGGAPLTIPSGTDLVTPVNGSVESDGTHLYWTNGSGTRRQLD